MIIDFHTHIYPQKIAEKTIDFLLDKIPYEDKKASTNGTVNGLLDSMKRSDVDYSVTLPVVTSPKQFDSINRYAVEIKNTKGIISFGGIHPDNENFQEKLDYIKHSGLKGIKLHPDYQDVYIDDKRYINIIRYCSDIGLKVVIHAGIDVGLPTPVHCPPEKSLKMINEVEADKKEPFIILAHMGGWMMQEDVKKMLCKKNVFFDTGYCLDKYSDKDLKDIINLHGADKILFATDAPWGDQKQYVDNLLKLNLGDDTTEKIFSLNAKRLLDI